MGWKERSFRALHPWRLVRRQNVDRSFSKVRKRIQATRTTSRLRLFGETLLSTRDGNSFLLDRVQCWLVRRQFQSYFE